MALMRAKWLALGEAVGFVGEWKTKSNAWEVEKLVEAAAPRPAAKQIADLLSNGSADRRQKRRLEESLRENARAAEESVRKQEETIRMQEDAMRKQEETIIRLLQTVLQRLQESDERVMRMQRLQCPPPVPTGPTRSS